VLPEDVPVRIWPLPVRRINGVGPKASERLHELGIHTIGELAARERDELVQRFGAGQGAWLHAAAHGRDERPVVTYSEPVSISRETTFERDLHPRSDRAELGAVFTDLCTRVAGDLLRKGYVGRTVGIKLRFDDFRTVTRDHTLDAPTGDAQAIRQAAGACLKRIVLSRRIRLLGVRVGSLAHLVPGQAPVTQPPPAQTAQPGRPAQPTQPGAPAPGATPSKSAARKPAIDLDTLPLFPLDADGHSAS
jgi:DNA polymerase-4